MVFSSIVFIYFFLPFTLALYFLIGNQYKNFFLLCASLIFYAWGENFFVLVMLLSITANYIFGLLIERYKKHQLSKFFFIVAVAFNLLLLCAYKYSNFIVDNINLLLSCIQVEPLFLRPIHLPIGISFFTFQAISYIIDVHRGETSAQKNLINMGVYIASFPQLIAGPIVRYHDVAQQIKSRYVTRSDFLAGIERFILGLGKKVLIANPVAVTVDRIFALPLSDLSTPMAWLGVICYSIQVYFDFSGYSDMAIGLGRMFGFRFMENFNYPYIAKSIQDFWQRWHISLTSWIRDYLFFPIALRRRKWRIWGMIYALVITYSLIGLWHGACWNFVLWGMYHGFFMIMEQIGFSKVLNRRILPLRILYVNIILFFSWPLFRAETLTDAVSYIVTMVNFSPGNHVEHYITYYLNNEGALALILGIVFATPVYPMIKKQKAVLTGKLKTGLQLLCNNVFAVSNTMMLISILLFSVMSVASGSYNPFIYFRF
ncbi:MAG: MBOAT family protein [Desulfobacteraceae bacterium]|nr:MAG: MBOAT family protein [Desulfobacteraceae bacterium]